MRVHRRVVGSLTGSVSDNGSGVLWLQITESLVDCASAGRNGRRVIVNGAPSLSLTGTFSYLGGAPATQQSLRWSGGFDWRVDGGPGGTCFVNLTFNMATRASGTSSLSGTVCGHHIARQW